MHFQEIKKLIITCFIDFGIKLKWSINDATLYLKFFLKLRSFFTTLLLLLKVSELHCKMFADDTTFAIADELLKNLIRRLKKNLEPLLEWCKFNKFNLNWSKTYFMFISDKRVKLQTEIEISGNLVRPSSPLDF